MIKVLSKKLILMIGVLLLFNIRCEAGRSIFSFLQLEQPIYRAISRSISRHKSFHQKRFYCSSKENLTDNLGVTIRHGTNSDVERWLRLRKELWPHCTEDKHRKEMQEYLEDSTKRAFLAEIGLQKTIGFLEVAIKDHAEGCPYGPIGYLEGLYVSPLHRRSKIATHLISNAESWCVKNGCKYMASDTEVSNHTSIKAHQSLNYEIARNLVHFIKKL